MEMFMREFISYSNKILEADNIWLLEQEFGDLREESICLELSCESGKRLENRRKNRYRDILPFDDTRVVLPQLLNDPDSDYINANLVRGATGQHYSYIAAQGPLRHTLGDFWRMLFHFNVKLIIMLCNERENDKPKCERYWPLVTDQPFMRVDVFDLTHWTDDEHYSAIFRDPSANADPNWEYRGDSANDASDHEPANGVAQSPREVCIASHYELELLEERETREAYVIRRIRATKVDTMLTWTEIEEPQSSPQKGNLTDNVNDKSDATSNEVRDPVANVSEAQALTTETDNPSKQEPIEEKASGEQIQSRTSTSEPATAQRSETEQNDTFYENVTQRKVRRTSRRDVHQEARSFVQYHYRNWADYAAADELDSILTMHNSIRQSQPSVVQPICVHCSAGCGRTGTILFIDYVQTLVNRGLLNRFLLRKRKSRHQPGGTETEQHTQQDEDEDDLSLNLKVDDDDDDDDRRRPQVPRLRLDDAMQSRSTDDESMDTKTNGGAEANADADLEYDYERSAREFVRSIVLEFRKQRPASVQSFEQFAMCYRATCEIFRKQLELLDAHQYANLEDLRTARRSASPQGPSSGQTPGEDAQFSNVDNTQPSNSTSVHTQMATPSVSAKLDIGSIISDPSDSRMNEQVALSVNSTKDVVDLTSPKSFDLLTCTERPARSKTPDADWTGLPHSNEPETAVVGNNRRQSKDDSHLQELKLHSVVITKGNTSSDVAVHPDATLTSE